MALYEYRCSRCEKITERERKMADRKKKTVCSFCGSRSTDLIISSSVNFELKSGGIGWANTGYSKGSPLSKPPKKKKSG